MKSNARRWSEEEWLRAKAMLDSGHSVKAVARLLQRTIKQVASKKQWMTISESQRARKNLQKQQRRAGAIPKIHRNQPSEAIHVPEEIVSDRNARLAAAKSITASIFGDPPPGWSALERRGA